MNPLDTVFTALAALAANRLRTALTMLGIVIGVSAVIALMAAGQGASRDVTERIRGLGTNLLFVRPGGSEQGGARGPEGAGLTLFDTDAYAMEDPEQFPYVDGVAPQVNFGAQLIVGGRNVNTTVIGTTPSYQYVRDFYVQDGQFISESDVSRRGLVMVLGANVADQLFPDEDPVNRVLRLSAGGGLVNFNFRVIGVMERKGASATANQDDLVFIPLPTMQARIPFLRNPQGKSNLMQISVRVKNRSDLPRAEQELGDLLRQRHGADDFTIQTQEDLLSTVNDVTKTLTILLGSIAGISLLVGGIGIMNIMLVSVTERTREIGIRKAVGATRRDILTQFLVEALVVTLLGGGLGVAIGVAAATGVDGRTVVGQKIQTSVTAMSVVVAVTVSAAIGIFFGMYPAYLAARLNPIEALRHE